MNLIDVLQEAQLLKDGEKPYKIGNRVEFEARSNAGVPLGFCVRVYKVDKFTGLSNTMAFSRAMAQDEIDHLEMRDSSGSPLATTVGKELAKLKGDR